MGLVFRQALSITSRRDFEDPNLCSKFKSDTHTLNRSCSRRNDIVLSARSATDLAFWIVEHVRYQKLVVLDERHVTQFQRIPKRSHMTSPSQFSNKN